MERVLSSHSITNLGMLASRQSLEVAVQQVTHHEPQMVVSRGLDHNVPRPDIGMELKTVSCKVLYHAIVVRLSDLGHKVWMVKHRLLRCRLAPARTAALLEVIVIVLRYLPAYKAKWCHAHAFHVVASIFEEQD